MLGLGVSLAKKEYTGGYSDPSSISGIALWLAFNTGVFSDEDASAGAVSHSTDAGNMTQNTKINRWKDISGNGNHALQSTSTKKPRWDITGNSGADLGGVKFPNNAKYMDLTSNIELTNVFTIMMRVRFIGAISNRSLIGNSLTDVLTVADSDKIQTLIGGSGTSNFEDVSATDIANGDPDKRQIITLTRDSSDRIKVYVNGGTAAGGWNDDQDDVDWDSAENHTDSDTFTISNIGSSADDTSKHNGFMYDVLVYKSVLTEDERKLNYDYLNAQTT